MGTNVEALEVRIKELELENMSLKSQLDKYQTIFALQGETVGKQVTVICNQDFTFHISKKVIEYFQDATGTPTKSRKVARGMGISAEPQSLKNLQVQFLLCFLLVFILYPQLYSCTLHFIVCVS